MKIKVLAPFVGATLSGIFGADGKEIDIGTILEVENEPTDWGRRYEVVDASPGKSQTAIINPVGGGPLNKAEITTDGENPKPGAENAPPSLTDDGTATPAAYEARDLGTGWWGIFGADGTQVGKSMRKQDAEDFNSLSDQDKAEFVKQDA